MSDQFRAWSVFDGVKPFSPSSPPTPETLMSDIDAAISSREYVHATSLLSSSSFSPSSDTENKPDPAAAGLADEAYKAACAALAAGKPDSALESLQVALVNCPPEKLSAVGKIRSLIAYASQQLRYRDQCKSPDSS